MNKSLFPRKEEHCGQMTLTRSVTSLLVICSAALDFFGQPCEQPLLDFFRQPCEQPPQSPHPPVSTLLAHTCTQVHRSTQRNQPLAQLARLMISSVSDVAYEPAPSPSPRFSLTHTRRCIGPRNATSPMATPARLMFLSGFDNSTVVCERLPSPLALALCLS